MDDCQKDTIDDDELIDHTLLKKIVPDSTSNGSSSQKEFKKLTSRRVSG